MHLTRPNYTTSTKSEEEQKRYLMMLIEEIERELVRLEEKSNGEDV